MADTRDDESFLGRWSRLKQQGGEADLADLKLAEAEKELGSDPAETSKLNAQSSVQSSDPDTEAPVKVLTDEDMPDIETLDAESDYSGFLSDGVSDALKRKAMRKLFHLPEFNIRDGLNDYDDDFSVFTPLGDTVTYQMKQWLEKEAEQAKADLINGDEIDKDDPEKDSISAAESSPATNSQPELLADSEDDFDDEMDAECG